MSLSLQQEIYSESRFRMLSVVKPFAIQAVTTHLLTWVLEANDNSQAGLVTVSL